MIRKVKNISESILAIVAVVLVIIVFLKPPTDYDGGPMLAYNFFFFIPMILIAGLLSLISIIIVIRKLIKKNRTNTAIKIITICMSLPVLIYAIVIFNYFFFPQDIDYPEYEFIPDPTYNCSDSIKTHSDKTIHFVGYHWGKKLENRRVYISLTPQACDTFSKVETYCYQGTDKLEVYYKLQKDSIYVYIPDDFGFYTHHGEKYLDRIPVRNIKLPAFEIDSMLNEDTKNLIMKFNW